MSFYVDAVEPFARPKRRTITLHEDASARLWALELDREAGAGLRRTVFRPIDEAAPEGAIHIATLQADSHGVTVVDVGTTVQLEWIRTDHRSRLVGGIRLSNEVHLDLGLPDGSRVDLTLHTRRHSAAGAELTVGGGGTRRSRVVYAADNVWWMITDGKGLAVTFGVKIWDTVRDRLMALGIDSRVLSFMSGLLLSAAAGLYVSYVQYQRAETQTERADTAESALARAEAAQAASLATELACLDQRQALVAELGAIDAKRALAAEMALGLALANKVAVEQGGETLADERLLEADANLTPGLTRAIVNRLPENAPTDVGACLGQSAALGNDLPHYLLLYHPDRALVCPTDYAVVDETIDRAGRFGLSDRLMREFRGSGDASTGAPSGTLESLLGDPRLEDRWSAFTLANAYRRATELLFSAGDSERPPVLPSQSQLWSLALLDAYNHVPSTPDGVLDAPMDVCVSRLLDHQIDHAAPAAPSEPILPDIVEVASGDVTLVSPPTPGCPWSADAIQQGAETVLNVVARAAGRTLEEDG